MFLVYEVAMVVCFVVVFSRGVTGRVILLPSDPNSTTLLISWEESLELADSVRGRWCHSSVLGESVNFLGSLCARHNFIHTPIPTSW